MLNDSILLQQKVKIYELLAKVFFQEPTAEFLELLQLAKHKNLLQSYDLEFFSDIKHLSYLQQSQKLSIEYARLFVVAVDQTSPRESVQRREGRLWGETTVAVSNIYKKFGFALDERFKDTPDHLSAELSFLAELTKLEYEYIIKDSKEALQGVRQVKKYFLKNHLSQWFFVWAQEVSKRALLAYYHEFTQFTGRFLNEEVQALIGVKDIPLASSGEELEYRKA